jgi:hypothetical protein
MTRLDNIQEKKKHAALGKTKLKTKKKIVKRKTNDDLTEEEHAQNLLRKAS